MTEPDRPDPPLAGDEASTLTGFLDHQRATLAWKCGGLDAAALRTRLAPTAMTLAGLLRHLTRVEATWFVEVVGERGPVEPWDTTAWAAEWQQVLDAPDEDVRGPWLEAVQRSRDVVAAQLAQHGAAALDRTHPAWGGEAEVSLRWVLTHMVEEYARHNGHADLLREAVDGMTGE